MEKNESDNRNVQVLRLLELIKDTDELIQLNRSDDSGAAVKGYLHLKNKLMVELQSLLKDEYNIKMKLEEAA